MLILEYRETNRNILASGGQLAGLHRFLESFRSSRRVLTLVEITFRNHDIRTKERSRNKEARIKNFRGERKEGERGRIRGDRF